MAGEYRRRFPAFGRGWLAQVCNAFLIRDPAAVLASYVAKRGKAHIDKC